MSRRCSAERSAMGYILCGGGSGFLVYDINASLGVLVKDPCLRQPISMALSKNIRNTGAAIARSTIREGEGRGRVCKKTGPTSTATTGASKGRDDANSAKECAG